MTRRTGKAARALLRGPSFLAAPLHPIFVHFTIALTAASFALDLVARLLHRSVVEPSTADAALSALAAAGVVTVATLFTGVLSRMRVPVENGPAHSYLRVHMALGPLFFGLLLVALAWRFVLYNNVSVVPWSYLALLGAVCAIMTAQGYVGGELVYRFGTAVVGRYRTLPIEHPGPRPCRPLVSTAAAEPDRA